MKRLLLLTFSTTLVARCALAADVSGAGALALAGIVAEHSPQLARAEKKVMTRFLNGNDNIIFPAMKKISVAADSIECRTSNVAIVEHACDLKFDAKTRIVTGRKAHELYATLVEVGATSEGAAGSVYESVRHLSCTIDPNEVKQNGGGGATCSYKLGRP